MKCDRRLLTEEQKSDGEYLSPTRICEFAKSPAHYRSKYILNESPRSTAMDSGKMFHMFLLEPEEFGKTYCVEPDAEMFAHALSTVSEIQDALKSRGVKVPTKLTKPELIDFCRANAPQIVFRDEALSRYSEGREIVPRAKFESLRRVKEEVLNDEWAKNLIFELPGENEHEFWYTESKTGIKIHGIADRVVDMGQTLCIVDLKGSRNAGNRYAFERDILNYNMHIQAAAYCDAFEMLYKKPCMFAWVSYIEKPPYIVSVFVPDEGTLAQGKSSMIQSIRAWRECKKQNKWPGPTKGLMVDVALPAYAFEQTDEESENESK